MREFTLPIKDWEKKTRNEEEYHFPVPIGLVYSVVGNILQGTEANNQVGHRKGTYLF